MFQPLFIKRILMWSFFSNSRFQLVFFMLSFLKIFLIMFSSSQADANQFCCRIFENTSKVWNYFNCSWSEAILLSIGFNENLNNLQRSKNILLNYWKKRNMFDFHYCFCLSKNHFLWFKWRELKLFKCLYFSPKLWMHIYKENNLSQITLKKIIFVYCLLFIFLSRPSNDLNILLFCFQRNDALMKILKIFLFLTK
jgi:hypothetical protein